VGKTAEDSVIHQKGNVIVIPDRHPGATAHIQLPLNHIQPFHHFLDPVDGRLFPFHLDGRTLPGPDGERLLDELRALVGPEVELEVTRRLPAVEAPADTPLFDTLAAALRRADPGAIPVPYLVPGFTDALAFSRLGTIWYGFAPVSLPPRIRFAELYHGVDERIPVEGFRWGVRVLHDAVRSFCASSW